MVSKLETAAQAALTVTGPLKNTDSLNTPKQNSALRLEHLPVGSQIQAKVLAILSNGQALIGLASPTGQPQPEINLELPLAIGLKPGDQIQLRLLANAGQQAQFALANDTHTDSVALSASGQLLEKLLNDEAARPTKLQGKQPLLNQSSPINPPHLASQLAKTVETSGLFYEAHLAAWQAGDRSLEQIRQEPQNQANTSNPNQWLPLQLDSLEHQHFVWQGELWQGQRLDWQIQQQNPDTASDADQEAAVWQTTLKLALPNLGNIVAKIRLQNQRVQLELDLENPAHRQALATAGPELGLALASLGTGLDQLAVHCNEQL